MEFCRAGATRAAQVRDVLAARVAPALRYFVELKNLWMKHDVSE